MKFYSVFLGEGRYVDLKHPDYWLFGLSINALTVDEHYALEVYRRFKANTNRYNPDGWPDIKFIEYDLVAAE